MLLQFLSTSLLNNGVRQQNSLNASITEQRDKLQTALSASKFKAFDAPLNKNSPTRTRTCTTKPRDKHLHSLMSTGFS